MGISSQLAQQSVTHLLEQFVQECAKGDVADEDSESRLEDVARKIAESGEPGLTFLLEQAMHADERMLKPILVSLTFAAEPGLQKLRPQIHKLLLARLENSAPLLKAEIIDSLRLLGFKEVEGKVLTFLNHPSPFVAGAVLRYLSATNPMKAIPFLLQGLASPEAIIRQNAIDELDELHCRDALPEIRLLLADPDPDVRQAAETAVLNLER